MLVTSARGARRNVVAAAGSMPVGFTPPRVAVVIDTRTVTHERLQASGAFALNLPGLAPEDLTCTVGRVSARAVAGGDKFAVWAKRPSTARC